MNEPDRFRKLAALFEQARTMKSADQAAFLQQACEGDTILRDELGALLQHHHAAYKNSSHSGQRHRETSVVFADDVTSFVAPGRQIGSFHVVSQIGRGGMGLVYRARQSHPSREVALKLIRPGILNAETIQRFEMETSALARLNHPGIAHIIESGVFEDGNERVPYFAMEFVDGLPLTDFVQQQQVDRDARLELFADICDAVQHAHQKGIIHRDLKPGNILVNSERQPKILDFGIARSTDPDQRLTRLLTAPGQMMGTLPYMSPEQLSDEEHLDTRSDVYALGVILYELLADRLPFELDNVSFLHGARMILEDEPRPLTSIDRELRGDLETIVQKALQKDPERRYASASDIAADVRRFLRHEPILARPATVIYSLRKFARRHRGLVAALAAGLLALVTGLTVAVWQSQRVLFEARTAREVIRFMEEMLTSVRPEVARGEPATMREVLDRASHELESRFADRPLVRAELYRTLGATYTAISEHQRASDHFRQAIILLDKLRGPNHEQSLRARSSLSEVLKREGQLDEAEQLARHTLARASKVQGTRGPQALDLKSNLSSILHVKGAYEEARQLAQEVLDGYRALYGEDHPYTLTAQGDFGVALMNTGDLEQAEEYFRKTLSTLQVRYGDDHPEVLINRHNLAAVVHQQGRGAEALEISEDTLQLSQRVLGAEHTRTLSTARNVVIGRFLAGDHDTAERLARQLVETCNQAYGGSHLETIASVEKLVAILGMSGRLAEAEALALQLFEEVERERGPTGDHVARAAWLLREVYDEWQKPDLRELWQSRHDDARAE